jgi:hypothetical protein
MGGKIRTPITLHQARLAQTPGAQLVVHGQQRLAGTLLTEVGGHTGGQALTRFHVFD